MSKEDSFRARLAHAWEVFRGSPRDDYNIPAFVDYGPAYSRRGDMLFMRLPSEGSIVGSIYSRIANEFADVNFRHVRLKNGAFDSEMTTSLNKCLTLTPNLDQQARAFFLDVALSLLEWGSMAIVPVETSENPINGNIYDILQLRVAKVVMWHPNHVKVSVYNQQTGLREEVTLPKKMVALVENPFYTIMNSPNSVLQRLIRKLALLDAIDEQSGSGKLDLIIQLPYVVRSETQTKRAEQRRTDIEHQLKDSKYGIAYTDGAEKIVQLNRPAENNIMEQIKWLTDLLHSQLGVTQEILNNTADAATMLNFHNRTVRPLLEAVKESMQAKFLTQTARTQGQSIDYFRDPFRDVTLEAIGELADTFIRNSLMSANEIRSKIGLPPSSDPGADKLMNPNMPVDKTPYGSDQPAEQAAEDTEEVTNEV